MRLPVPVEHRRLCLLFSWFVFRYGLLYGLIRVRGYLEVQCMSIRAYRADDRFLKNHSRASALIGIPGLWSTIL